MVPCGGDCDATAQGEVAVGVAVGGAVGVGVGAGVEEMDAVGDEAVLTDARPDELDEVPPQPASRMSSASTPT